MMSWYRMSVTKLAQKNQGKRSESNGCFTEVAHADCDARRYSAKEAVAAMIKRLAHRNANVQLYTLEVRDLGDGLILLSYVNHI